MGREQRLAAMIKDTLEGRGEDHWNAAMRCAGCRVYGALSFQRMRATATEL